MAEWLELFNGRTLEGWTARGVHSWVVAGGVTLDPADDRQFVISPSTGIFVNGSTGRTVDLHTISEFGSCELSLEFCVPRGSNSGVYLAGQYEIQVLDSWGTPDSELTFGSCGGIYARWIEETRQSYDGAAPRVNASRPPGEWQSYQVVFHAAKVDAAGRKLDNARFERVLHNGVLIHEGFECSGPTRGAWCGPGETDLPRGPLRLQGDHGPVAYRNVRLRVLD